MELQISNNSFMKYLSTIFEKVILFSLHNFECGFKIFQMSQKMDEFLNKLPQP